MSCARICGTPYREGKFPGHWRDEQTDLPECVEAYFKHIVDKGPEPTPHQLDRIKWYIAWWIDAPCWNHNYDCELADQFKKVRESAHKLTETCGAEAGRRDNATAYGL